MSEPFFDSTKVNYGFYNKKICIQFLQWLVNRMKFVYKEENEDISKNIWNVIYAIERTSKAIPEETVERICLQLYPNWELESDLESEFDVGFSEEERTKTRYFVKQVIEAYQCRNSPTSQESLLST